MMISKAQSSIMQSCGPSLSRRLLSSCSQARSNRTAMRTGLGVFVVFGSSACVMVALSEEDRMDRWKDRWQKNNISWHRTQPYGILVKHYDKFMGVVGTGEGAEAKPDARENYRVLVPLCGKTVDMPFLAEKGHEVVGIEGCEAAAWQLQRDAWLNFQVSREPSRGGVPDGRPDFIPASTFEKQRAGYVFKTDERGTGYYLDTQSLKWFRDTRKGLSLVIQDFFNVGPRDVGTFDRIWDRGSLVAIRPQDRENYVALCDSLLSPGGRILLATYDYDRDRVKGPPHSIPLAEVQNLYGKKYGYKIELLSSDDVRNEYQGAKWEKLPADGLHELAILMTKPTSSGPGWFARIFLRRNAVDRK